MDRTATAPGEPKNVGTLYLVPAAERAKKTRDPLWVVALGSRSTLWWPHGLRKLRKHTKSSLAFGQRVKRQAREGGHCNVVLSIAAVYSYMESKPFNPSLLPTEK